MKILHKIIEKFKGDKKPEIFNSIRINALVDELKDKGIINNNEYNEAIEKQVKLLLQRRSE